MTSTKETPKRKRTPRPAHPAADKVQAILALWTDRCRPADICQQMNISPVVLSQWQRRALEGMMQALECRVNLANGQLLSPRLQTLLAKHRHQIGLEKLEKRLQTLGKPAVETKTNQA